MTQTRLVGALLAVGLLAGAPVAAEPKVGSRLDQSTWEEAKDLLAPEILAHYKDGVFAAPIGEIKPGDYALDDRFHQATKANAGKFKLDEHGSVVEAATGKPPEYSLAGPSRTWTPRIRRSRSRSCGTTSTPTGRTATTACRRS